MTDKQKLDLEERISNLYADLEIEADEIEDGFGDHRRVHSIRAELKSISDDLVKQGYYIEYDDYRCIATIERLTSVKVNYEG